MQRLVSPFLGIVLECTDSELSLRWWGMDLNRQVIATGQMDLNSLWKIIIFLTNVTTEQHSNGLSSPPVPPILISEVLNALWQDNTFKFHCWCHVAVWFTVTSWECGNKGRGWRDYTDLLGSSLLHSVKLKVISLPKTWKQSICPF